MNYKYIILSSFSICVFFVSILDVSAESDTPFIAKPTQYAIEFERLDLNADEVLTKDEISNVYGVLYDKLKKESTYSTKKKSEGKVGILGSLSGSVMSRNINVSKEDFIESNVSRIYENDADNNGKLSISEYQVRTSYDFTKEQCNEIIKKHDSKPRSFGAVADSVMNGDSHKIGFCRNKYQ